MRGINLLEENNLHCWILVMKMQIQGTMTYIICIDCYRKVYYFGLRQNRLLTWKYFGLISEYLGKLFVAKCNLHITMLFFWLYGLAQSRNQLIVKFRSWIICEIVILKLKYQFKCRLKILYPQLATILLKIYFEYATIVLFDALFVAINSNGAFQYTSHSI